MLDSRTVTSFAGVTMFVCRKIKPWKKVFIATETTAIFFGAGLVGFEFQIPNNIAKSIGLKKKFFHY